MSPIRMLSLAFALAVSLIAGRGYASGEVQLLRTQASLHLGRTPTEWLTFDIRIKNLAYAKHVTIHLDGGAGVWTDLDASYVRAVDAETELWQARIGYYDPRAATATYTFSVKYEVAGQTFWDDNGGTNYTLQVRGGDGFLLTTPVLLDSVYADGVFSEVVGRVGVQNLAYAKKMTVFYTTDNWLTVNSAPAKYDSGPWYGNAEKWSFRLTGVTHLPIQYAIAYEAGGVTYWDNNYGQNYTIGIP